jgi:hypothetical protein
MLNMDLNWEAQHRKMNGMVHKVASSIRSGKSTLLQGTMLLRDSLPQQLEIGMRHAYITKPQISLWDTVLTGAVATRAGIGHGSLQRICGNNSTNSHNEALQPNGKSDPDNLWNHTEHSYEEISH